MPRVREQGIRSERLEFFSDAVLAVAITLMVLRITPPNAVPGQGEAATFWDQVVPQIIFYLITFWVIVELWRRHHDIFSSMPKYATPRQFGLNMCFLAAICLLPFGLEYYSSNPPTVFATAVYAVLIALPTLCIALLAQDVTGIPSRHGYVMCGIFLLAIPLAPLLGSWALLVWAIDLPLRKVSTKWFGPSAHGGG